MRACNATATRTPTLMTLMCNYFLELNFESHIGQCSTHGAFLEPPCCSSLSESIEVGGVALSFADDRATSGFVTSHIESARC